MSKGNSTLKRLLSLAIVLCMAMFAVAGFAEATEAQEPIVINILHTNDVHGTAITPATENMIRYSQIATMKKSFENAILVDGGDMTQGTAYVALTDGLAALNGMRLAGYDVATLGNHEFTANRSHYISSLTSPADNEMLFGDPVYVVANNVFGEPVLESLPEDVFIVERAGVKVGFFGMATPTTLTTGNPAVNVGITIGNICDAAEKAVAELKEKGADVIVGVTHLGYDPEVNGWDGDSSVSLASNIEGIDVIIDPETKEVLSKTSHSITAEEAFANYEEDPTVKAYLDETYASVDADTSVVIANISMALYGGHYRNGENVASIARRGETNAVALECDGKVRAAKQYFEGTEYEDLPIVSLVCGGSCRTLIPAGDVTVAQIMNLCLNAGLDPSGVYLKTTGAVLWETVEWGLSCLITQDPETGAIIGDGSYHGRFPNLGGATFVYDVRNEGSTPLDFDPETYKMGSRLVSLTLADGTEITKDSDVELILATNDFELGGGDGYFMLQRAMDAGQLERIGTSSILFMDATIDYMQELLDETGDVYYPLTSGRITCIGDYDKDAFDCVVTVLNPEGAPVQAAEAELFVNYGTAAGIEWVSMGTFETDENGQFTASLANGPQETKVVIDGVESTIMYVDNFAGMLDTTNIIG